jgi:hypothetical protein
LGSTGASFALDSTGTLMLLLNECFPPPILIFKGEDDLCRTMLRPVRRECWRNTAKFLEEGMLRSMAFRTSESSQDLRSLSFFLFCSVFRRCTLIRCCRSKVLDRLFRLYAISFQIHSGSRRKNFSEM